MPAQAEPRQGGEGPQRAAARPQDDGDPQRDFPGAGGVRRVQGGFPGAGHVHGKAGAEFAVGLCLGPVVRVPVDGAGAGVEPGRRRRLARCQGAAERGGGGDAGIEDGCLVPRVIAAVDRPSGEVDQQVGAVQHPGDGAVVVPVCGLSRTLGCPAADGADCPAVPLEASPEVGADEARGSGEHHGVCFVHFFPHVCQLRMLRLRLRTSSSTLLTPGILASESPRAISGTAPSTSFRVRRWPSEVSYTQNSAIPM